MAHALFSRMRACFQGIMLLTHIPPYLSHTPCRPFTSNAAAQCIYFFKCCYFILSALQIVAGYPNRILGYFLGSKYTTVSGLAFQVYRVIPILSELREVMDWMFTDTVLNLLHWFRVQEIYAQVYLVKVRREREEVSRGHPSLLSVKVCISDHHMWPCQALGHLANCHGCFIS